MTHLTLFKVGSWNNCMHCVSFYILKPARIQFISWLDMFNVTRGMEGMAGELGVAINQDAWLQRKYCSWLALKINEYLWVENPPWTNFFDFMLHKIDDKTCGIRVIWICCMSRNIFGRQYCICGSINGHILKLFETYLGILWVQCDARYLMNMHPICGSMNRDMLKRVDSYHEICWVQLSSHTQLGVNTRKF